MFIYTFIAFTTLFIFFISMVVALCGWYHFYWLAALSVYIFSFIAGFSIGQLTVGLTFIPLTLAIASTFGWIKGFFQGLLFASVELVIGFFMVVLVGNELFYPIFIFL